MIYQLYHLLFIYYISLEHIPESIFEFQESLNLKWVVLQLSLLLGFFILETCLSPLSFRLSPLQKQNELYFPGYLCKSQVLLNCNELKNCLDWRTDLAFYTLRSQPFYLQSLLNLKFLLLLRLK